MRSHRYKNPSFPRRRESTFSKMDSRLRGNDKEEYYGGSIYPSVIPAKAGIQFQKMDSGFRRNDGCSLRIRGFTLLEVLVALTVLGISFMAVLGTAGQAINASAHLRDKTFAHWIGMNVIAEQRIGGVWPDTGTSDGEVQMANREWTWEMEVTETAAEHLRRIDVRVFFEDKPEDALALVTGFIGEPQILMGLPGTGRGRGENGDDDRQPPPPPPTEPEDSPPPDKDPP